MLRPVADGWWRAPHQEPTIRFFASSHQLSQFAPRTRILCALFLLGILAQAVSGVLMHHLGPGWTPASVAAYYRGDEAGDPAVTTPGDRFGVVEDESAATPVPTRTMHVARSFGTLVEVAHLHLVAMPLVLFVVAHLFSMTPLGRGAVGGALCYVGFACAAADIMAPFAVRYVSAGIAPVKIWFQNHLLLRPVLVGCGSVRRSIWCSTWPLAMLPLQTDRLPCLARRCLGLATQMVLKPALSCSPSSGSMSA